MIKNTYIAKTIDRAFDGLDAMLGESKKAKPCPNKKKKKCCGGSKCKSSKFVPDKTKEKEKLND